MKNWEKIIEIYEKSEIKDFETVAYNKIYNFVPDYIKEDVIDEWDYQRYDSEQSQFADNFRTEFGAFLYIVKDYTGNELEKLSLCNYSKLYAESYRRRRASKDQGSIEFEKWLCTEESPYKETPTKHREMYLGGSVTIEPNSDINLSEVLNQMARFDGKKSFAYLMYLYKEEEIPVYLKVGKTSNVKQRQRQLMQQYKLERIEVIKLFDFNSDEEAEMMESFMRKYYKTKYEGKNFVPRDRFEGGICSEEELQYFEKKARLIAAAAEL